MFTGLGRAHHRVLFNIKHFSSPVITVMIAQKLPSCSGGESTAGVSMAFCFSREIEKILLSS